MQKIGEPVLTADVQNFFENVNINIPESEALPELRESEASALEIFDDEPLVELKHPLVKTLNCYWEAGWENALAGCWIRKSVAEKLYDLKGGGWPFLTRGDLWLYKMNFLKPHVKIR